jgi:WG repeat protein
MKKYYAGSLQRIIKLLFFLFLSGSVQAQELVVFKGASDKYGYKNTAGAVVIPAKYQQAEEFGYEELAGVKYNSKWGMVDKKGKRSGSTQIRPAGEGQANYVFERTPGSSIER